MTRQTAQEEYAARTAKIRRELWALLRGLARHGQQAASDPENWGYCGDMGNALERLWELNAFMGSHEARSISHPCPHCGREENGGWFDPCPTDDCLSNTDPNEADSEDERRDMLRLQYRLKAVRRIEGLAFLADEDDVTARDTMTDLMHWCAEKGIDFEEELRIARGHFAAESEGLE